MEKTDKKRWKEKKKDLLKDVELHLDWYFRCYKTYYDKWDKFYQKTNPSDFKGFLKSCKAKEYQSKSFSARIGFEASKEMGCTNGYRLQFYLDGTIYNILDNPFCLGQFHKGIMTTT